MTGLDNVNINTEVEFVKKASCSSVDMKISGQYLIMGADSMPIRVGRSYKWVCALVFILDYKKIIKLGYWL